MEKINKNILITFLYAIVTLVLVLHHEIWADEAQVWLLAKNLSIFDFSLFKHLVNEGHPSFFYLLVMPFAKAKLPIITMQLICWLSMTAAVFLFLQYSPFNRFTKFSIITSAGFLYFFPVIARSYSIIPLLVFLLAALYSKQKNYPICYSLLIIMLANTHIIMFAFAACLGAQFIYNCFKNTYKNKRFIFASLLIILGLLAVILQLSGSIESNNSLVFDTGNILKNAQNTLISFFVNITNIDSDNLAINQTVNFAKFGFIFAAIEGLVFFVCLLILLFMNGTMFALAVIAIAFQLFIYTFSYHVIYPTRIFCAFIIIIFCYWISLQSININIKKKLLMEIILSLLFILTLGYGIQTSLKDYKQPYSATFEAAKFIQKNIDKDSLIIPDIDAYCAGIIMYLPEYRFYSIYNNKDLKFIEWKITGFYSPYVISQLLEEEKHKQKKKHAYIISSNLLYVYNYENLIPGKYKLIYTSPSAIKDGESFRIYEYIEGKD